MKHAAFRTTTSATVVSDAGALRTREEKKACLLFAGKIGCTTNVPTVGQHCLQRSFPCMLLLLIEHLSVSQTGPERSHHIRCAILQPRGHVPFSPLRGRR